MDEREILRIADHFTFTWDEDVIAFARAIERQTRAALAATQAGWISVKDRLPDEPGDYLLFRPTAHLPPASNAGMTSPALNLTG